MQVCHTGKHARAPWLSHVIRSPARASLFARRTQRNDDLIKWTSFTVTALCVYLVCHWSEGEPAAEQILRTGLLAVGSGGDCQVDRRGSRAPAALAAVWARLGPMDHRQSHGSLRIPASALDVGTHGAPRKGGTKPAPPGKRLKEEEPGVSCFSLPDRISQLRTGTCCNCRILPSSRQADSWLMLWLHMLGRRLGCDWYKKEPACLWRCH